MTKKCTRCKNNPPVDGKNKCQDCIDYCKDYNLKRYAESRSLGVCALEGCNNPTKGKAYCTECRSKRYKRNKIAIAKAKEDGKCITCRVELTIENAIIYRNDGSSYLGIECMFCRDETGHNLYNRPDPEYYKYMQRIGDYNAENYSSST